MQPIQEHPGLENGLLNVWDYVALREPTGRCRRFEVYFRAAEIVIAVMESLYGTLNDVSFALALTSSVLWHTSRHM
jgi:hypothetical protein